MAFEPIIDDAKVAEDGSQSEAAYGAFIESNWFAAQAKYGRDYSPTPQETEDLANGTFDFRNSIPQGYETFAKEYATTGSAREADMLTDNINTQLKYRDSMEQFPGTSFAASLVGAVLSPEQYPLYMIPGGGVVKASTLARTGIKSAAFGAGSATVAEVAMSDVLPVRTGEESLYAIGGSAIFAGALGVLGKSIGNVKEVSQSLNKLDQDMAAESTVVSKNLGVAEDFRGMAGAEVVEEVAAAVDKSIKSGEVKLRDGVTREGLIDQGVVRLMGESTKVKHPNLYRVMGKISPAVRFATSKLPEGRLFGMQIVDSGLQRRGAAVGPSAQLIIEQQVASLHTQIPTKLNDRYLVYKQSTTEKIMSYKQFREAVGESMAVGDKNANPHVQDAASDLRKILKPIEDRLLDAGLIKADYDGFIKLTPDDIKPLLESPNQVVQYFKTDGTPRKNISSLLKKEMVEKLHLDGKLNKRAAIPLGDSSYIHRRFDLVKIRGNRKGFHDDVVRIFREDFTAKENAKLEVLRQEIADRRAKLKPGEGKGSMEGARRSPEQVIKDLETKLQERIDKFDADMKLINQDMDQAVNEVISALMREEAHESFRIKSVTAGPLKGRTFDIAFSRIKNWLIADASEAWSSWSKNIIPDLVLTERFGDTSAKAARDNVLKAYDAKYLELERAGDSKAARSVSKEKEQFVRDSKAMVEILKNKFQKPQDPAGMLHKSSQYLRWGAMVTRLGMMTVSAIPDIGIIVGRQGLNAMKFGKHVVGFTPEVKANRTFLKQLGTMADLFTSHRIEMLNMVDGNYALTNRVDRFAHAAVQKFNQLTLMNHWNAHLKAFTSGIYAFGIMDDAARALTGKLTSKQILRYAAGGLSEADLKAIGKITKPDGDSIPDFSKWKDQGLAERFKVALFKEAENTVITPGAGDLPLTSHSDLGRIMFQFKSFAIAANHKMLMTTIDDLTAQKVIGMLTMGWFGYMSYAAKQYLKGKEPTTDPDMVIKEAIDRSGIFALWGDLNLIMERATKGNLSAYKALGLEGEPLSRHQFSGLTDLIAGPSAGVIEDLSKIATAITSGEVKESDVRAMRRSLYLNNHFLLHQAFTQMEESTYNFLK